MGDRRAELNRGAARLGLLTAPLVAVGVVFGGFTTPDRVVALLLTAGAFGLCCYSLFTPHGRERVARPPQRWDRRTERLGITLWVVLMVVFVVAGEVLDADLWQRVLVGVPLIGLAAWCGRLVITRRDANHRRPAEA